MKLYRLRVPPVEDGNGLPTDVWFTNLREAKAFRAKLLKENVSEYQWSTGFEICRVKIADLPKVKLAVRLLNTQAYLEESEVVVKATSIRRE